MALLELDKLRRDINILFGYVKCLMAKEDETSPLVATEWSANHSTATGNPYTADTYVFYNGHVYKCKANNDGIPPTNTTYWLDLGEGHLLAEEQSNWNATGGRRAILNKPTNTSDFNNDGEDGTSPYVTQDEMNAALPDPQNLDEVLAEGDSAPTRSANVKEVGLYDDFDAPSAEPGYAKIYASNFKVWLKDKLGANIVNFQAGAMNFMKGIYTFKVNFPTLTANRTATFQDKSGVVAYLSDIVSGAETDPIFTTWLATNPLAPYFLAPSGTTSQYIRGDGTLATFPTIPGGIPAGGTAGQILTKVDGTDYNATWQENYADWTSVVKHTVKNNGTGLITKGTPVYVTSSNGTNMLVGKASNTSEATSSKTMGLMQSDITTTGGTQTGFVVTEGLLGGLNTAGTTAGDPVWLGPTGTLIYGLINKPYAPAHLVFIGIVTKVSAGSGEIFVKVQNGFELKEIHDVDLITTAPSNGEVLTYEASTGLWKNKPASGGNSRVIVLITSSASVGALASTDYILLCSNTINVTLPTAVGNTNLYTIKNTGTGVVTIDTTSSQTIDGSLTAPISLQYQSLTLVSNGANWNII
jgi:hypothetical protein